MIGLELTHRRRAPVVEACLQRRLLINCTHNTVIRLLPAMTLTAEQVDEGCDILAEALHSVAGVTRASAARSRPPRVLRQGGNTTRDGTCSRGKGSPTCDTY